MLLSVLVTVWDVLTTDIVCASVLFPVSSCMTSLFWDVVEDGKLIGAETMGSGNETVGPSAASIAAVGNDAEKLQWIVLNHVVCWWLVIYWFISLLKHVA